MRKISSFLITFLITLNSFYVTCYADNDSFVTRAVVAVKEKINIPKNYTEFNSKLTVEEEGQYAYFTWYGEDDAENPGGQISVTVDDKFRILSFSQYFYGNFNGDYKLSKYTSEDARNISNAFISKACPEFYPDTILLEQEYSVHRNFEPYKFKYIRFVNDLPCYDNYIEATVNSNNGIVSAFEVHWTDYDKIYPAKTTLSKIDASIKMYDNFGMVKEYAKKTDGSLYVRYSDLSDGVNYINAYTGNIINTNHISTAGTYKNALTTQKDFNFWYLENPFDIEGIVEIAENNSYIPAGTQYTLTGIQYLQDNYSTYLYMYYEDTYGNIKTYIVDALNGDIRYYDFYQAEIGKINYNYNKKQCEKIAKNFAVNYNKSFINSCKLLNYGSTKNYNGEEIIYYNYTRYINDIAYDNNGVVIGISRSTGEIVSVRSGWDIVKVNNYDLTISQDEAFEKYIKETGFELQYVTAVSMSKQNELRPVYAPNPLHDIYIDAVNGNIIDKNGNVIDMEKILYTDINNHISEEQIKTLYACGILDESEKFKPDENILLCDFLLWMCRAIDCAEYKDILDVSAKLVESGIITYDDIVLNKPLDTETGIKYIVSYLGYSDIAILNDTFKTDFVDEGMISPDMIGYAAIAKGLKIFKGNAFMPKEFIKRNVAAQIFYNLISN